jgi:hypothetical protein
MERCGIQTKVHHVTVFTGILIFTFEIITGCNC